MKRIKRTVKGKKVAIRCNRNNYRKKNKKFVGAVKYRHKGKKIKGSEWEKIERL
jgi:hypothetical protein